MTTHLVDKKVSLSNRRDRRTNEKITKNSQTRSRALQSRRGEDRTRTMKETEIK